MATNEKKILHARKPDLVEERNGRRLLVWGDLAQWMVVDAELFDFLGKFNGHRTLREAVIDQARTQGKPVRLVEKAALQAAAELMKRRILCEKIEPVQVQPEAVKIANVTINLTNRCNLSCAWCYNSGHRTAEMPIERLMDGIKQGKDVLAENASIIILGGEPFLGPERLLTALDRAEKIFAGKAMVSTNGTLLGEGVVDSIAARNVEVQVSLDGPDRRRNDARRGGGVFDKACAGIGRLVRAGVPTIMSMAFSRETTSEFEEYLGLALKLGVDEARFIPMRMIGEGARHLHQAPDLNAAFEQLLDVLERRPEFRRLLRRDYFSIAMTICKYSDFRTGCGIGRKVIFIDADGKVYPCPNHLRPEYLCGNLDEEHLGKIARESPVMEATRRQYQVCRFERCRDCTFRYWCAGDCRGEVLSVYSDPLKPSPHCEEHQKLMKRMLWLIAEGDPRLGLDDATRQGKRAVDEFAV